VRTGWRERVRPRVLSARPFVLAAMAAMVLIFGAIGFAEVYPHDSVLDQLYRALQLFAFGGNVSANPDLWLEIARFLGPFVVGYAAAQAVIALYREQLQLLRFRMMRNHVVVAGVGSAGLMMAASFQRADWQVVVIEQNALSPAVKGCRELGIGVVIGDARDRNILRKAGCKHAILLVVVCGEDGTNLDVAAAARTVARDRRRGVLTALVELDDFELWGTIKAQALLDRDESPFRLELFNSFALAGELLLSQHPAFEQADPGSPHVVIVGTYGVASSLITEIARQWISSRRGADDVLRVTLVGSSADDLDQLVARVSGLDRVSQLELRALSVDLIASESPPLADLAVSAVYLSLESETAALKIALILREQQGVWASVPITIAVADQNAGVGGAVSRGGPALEGVTAFGVLRQTLTPLALSRTVTEQLAQLSHMCHVKARIALGDNPNDPSLVDWDQLPDPLRESNRLSADRIPEELAQLGYVVVTDPLIDLTQPWPQFSGAEIERLAPWEHQHWQAHMKRIGYRAGAVKDNRRKRHPLIDVPYQALPEDNKEKDRAHVRAIPEILAKAGFRIRRVGDEADESARDLILRVGRSYDPVLRSAAGADSAE
jgi:voltage-gated potassium channel Kch